MIERFFYKTLSEELTKRGFFVATEHAPENCVGIYGVNSTEKRVKYVEYLQENYRLAAIKNIIFCIGNDSIGKDATWMVVSLYPNGRKAHFFRYGYKISKKDLLKDEMFGFTSWVYAVERGMRNGNGFNP